MTFDVAADAYQRFMGRFSEPLAQRFAALADPQAGQRALDVGCGPGALTAELTRRLGPAAVAAIDPSASFIAAVGARCPGVDVRRASAEQLPFPAGIFDLALAQLVVHFMADPVAGLREMARVTVVGGTVAACVWDNAGGTSPLSLFWKGVRELTPTAVTEADLPGSAEGHLAELFRAAGLHHVDAGSVSVSVRFESFEDWWQPYTLGVGPAGDHVRSLDNASRHALRERCAQLLPPPPFEITARAWSAVGTA